MTLPDYVFLISAHRHFRRSNGTQEQRCKWNGRRAALSIVLDLTEHIGFSPEMNTAA